MACAICIFLGCGWLYVLVFARLAVPPRGYVLFHSFYYLMYDSPQLVLRAPGSKYNPFSKSINFSPRVCVIILIPPYVQLGLLWWEEMSRAVLPL